MAAELQQKERQQPAAVGAAMALAAAHGILQRGQVLEIAEAQTGEAEFRSLALLADHGANSVRMRGGKVQGRRNPREAASALMRPGAMRDDGAAVPV